MSRRAPAERGSATVLVLACLLAGGLVTGLWVRVAQAGVARQRAEAAADLAALAAAAAVAGASGTAPCVLADLVARRNAARLDSCVIEASTAVEVSVSVTRPMRASSRARAGPVSEPLILQSSAQR